MTTTVPPVVLFGYDSSPFTEKIRLALRIKQIPYTLVTVPSMMPRPILQESFHLTYRKIPVLAIGRDLYCDTSIILEVLEHLFTSVRHASLYPGTSDSRSNRALIRGFASYWTDRPLFRVTTGLIPGSVWQSAFGTDRKNLIGHTLNPSKLQAKVPRNLLALDLQLSLLEGQLRQGPGQAGARWLFGTHAPSLADISLFYQLSWGNEIAAGRGIDNLTGGATSDTNTKGATAVFNADRFPAVLDWFNAFKAYVDALPLTETRVTDKAQAEAVVRQLDKDAGAPLLLPTPVEAHKELHEQVGLVPGRMVSVAPDDTGRDSPTLGKLIAFSPEEVVIVPKELAGQPKRVVNARVHFPRLGFVVLPVAGSAKL